MKDFIRKTILFLLILLGILFFLFAFLNYHDNKLLGNYRTNVKVENVFIGDSHLQCAVNDKIVGNSINISQYSESPYFSYFKLKEIVKNNPSIKCVYLGFGYHSISSYFDDYTFGQFSQNISAKYFFILPFDQKMFLLKKNVKSIPLILKNAGVFAWNNLFVKKKQFAFLGKYANNFFKTVALQKSMDKRLVNSFI